MSDLIKRVVSIIEDFDVLDGYQDKETLINKIKAISSTEPETTSDLIDRQKLLEKATQIPVAKVVTSDKVIYRKAVFVEDIEQMPSAESHSRNLCDSCINNGCIFQSGIVRNHCDFYKSGRADRKEGKNDY